MSDLARPDGQPPSRPLRIDIAVHGRFYAFHLARALIARGHDVRVLTNYPGWAAERFGVPAHCVQSFVSHAIASRLYDRTLGRLRISLGQPALHRAFGAWAARHVREDADLIHVFSGVAEETLRRFEGRTSPRIWLARGSAHIRTQLELLAEEERRARVPIDKPYPWIVAREEREYALADAIVTLSTFSHRTVAERPGLKDKALLLLAGVDTRRFRPQAGTVADRLARIARGDRLRILTVGTFSFQKGALDIAAVVRQMHGRASFRFVGDLPRETRGVRQACAGLMEFVPRVPEFELSAHYAWGDIFLFPTIQDGFPLVVAQAQASGLPVVTTPNGSGPDLVTPGVNGWIVPIRSPQAIVDTLTACNRDRAFLRRVTEANNADPKTRDWSSMAIELEAQFAARSAGGVGTATAPGAALSTASGSD
jgi:glycosyltransferase involved in cell wall biosynthesis